MAEIFVCGHGGWGTIGRSRIFVDVTGFTEVLFYKEIGYPLTVAEAMAILSRAPGALQPERSISRTQCPDMSLYPAREFWNEFGSAAKKGGVEWLAVAQETSLSDLLKRWSGTRIHWIACSVREMA